MDFDKIYKKSLLADKLLADGVPLEVAESVILHGNTRSRAWREYKGITIAEMAERLGYTFSGYYKLEQKPIAKQAVIEKIAKELGITVESFLIL